MDAGLFDMLHHPREKTVSIGDGIDIHLDGVLQI
jgi:hypothetical protein